MKEIVIISGKGGTGKTTLTASLAGLWDNAVVADCDVDAADLHLLLQPDIKTKSDFISGVIAKIDHEKCTECGICRDLCKYNAISPDFQINEIDCEGCAVCSYLCPENAISLTDAHCGEWYISDTRYGPMVHAKLGVAKENSGKLVTLIRKKAKEIAEEKNLDMILVDGAPGIGCPVISSMANASLVVIITEPSISGIHDLKRVIDLTKHFNVQASIVINKYDINPQICGQIEEYAYTNKISILGKIKYDPTVIEAMVQGKTIREYDGTNTNKVIEKIFGGVNKLLSNQSVE
jgi:MinD superfamily P-loop ATPase